MLVGAREGLGQATGYEQGHQEETLGLSFGCGRMTEESEEEAAHLEVCCNPVAQGKATMSCHMTAAPSFLRGLGSLTLGESSDGCLQPFHFAMTPECHRTA